MDRLIQFLNTSEGRDKTGKTIQYASRIIQWHQKGINDDIHQSFKNLYSKSHHWLTLEWYSEFQQF